MLSAFLNRERHDPSRCAWRHGCAMSTGGRKSSSSYRTAPAWNGKRGGLLTHTKQPELVLAHRSGSPTGRTPADEKVTAATSIKKTATPSFIFTFRVKISGWKPCLVETANRGTQREGRRRFRGRQCRLAGLSALLKPKWTRLSHTLGHSTLIGTEQIKREYDTGSVTRRIFNRKWRAGHLSLWLLLSDLDAYGRRCSNKNFPAIILKRHQTMNRPALPYRGGNTAFQKKNTARIHLTVFIFNAEENLREEKKEAHSQCAYWFRKKTWTWTKGKSESTKNRL